MSEREIDKSNFYIECMNCGCSNKNNSDGITVSGRLMEDEEDDSIIYKVTIECGSCGKTDHFSSDK